MDVKQAAAHAKNLAKQFRGVMEVAEVLETIGNLEQVWSEAVHRAEEARREAARAADEREKATEALVHAQDALEATEEAVARAIQNSETQAKEIIDNAKIEAGGIIAVVRKQVDGLKQKLGTLEEEYVNTMARFAAKEVEAREKVAVLEGELAVIEKRITG